MSHKNKKILAVITARGGSKRLPQKNIRVLAGKPMIAHVIESAKNSSYIDRLIVSTDDPRIAEVSKRSGAEVPFMRPAELSTDVASSLAVLEHAVAWMEREERFLADIIVLMQPTSPLVLPEDVDGTIEKMVSESKNTALSVSGVSERPEWMFLEDQNGVSPFIDNIPEDARSQDFTPLFISNGAVYAMKRDVLMDEHKIRDRNSVSLYHMPDERSIDIDTELDFRLAEAIFKNRV